MDFEANGHIVDDVSAVLIYIAILISSLAYA